MPKEKAGQESRPDISEEQVALAISIAKKAELLIGRKIDSADFNEPQSQGYKTAYSYRSGKNKKIGFLTVQTDLPDTMAIAYNATTNRVSFSYAESGFGIFLKTTLEKGQDGYEVTSHYTNDPAVVSDLLKRAEHRLEYANQEITKREKQEKV